MKYEEAVLAIAQENNLSADFVNKTYRAYWKAVKQHITSLPLKENLSDEEFLKLRPNVNIPSIGKLYITLNRYRGVKKTIEYKNENLKKKIERNNYVEDREI